MIDSCRIAVVVPAKNEERFVGTVVRTLPSFVDVPIVVDDGSDDDTSGVARRASDRVVVIRHPRSRGVGGAIVAGYRRALDDGADVVAVMAGDGQMDPAELGDVVGPVVAGQAGYVKGNRLRHPDVWRVMPWHRLVGTAVLGTLTARATGLALSDSQCGYTAIGRDALERIDLDGLWTGYGYPNDLLGALARARVSVREVTVRPVYGEEHSGLRARHVGTILWLLGRAARMRFVTSGS